MVGIGFKTMEANHGGGGGGGTMPASMGSSAAAAAAGIVGLDMSLHDNRRRSGTTTTQPPQQHHFLPFPTTQHHHEGLIDDSPQQQQQQQLRHTYAAFPTQQQQTPLDLLSDHDHEPAAFGVGDDDGANKRFPQQSSSSPSPSPWHRMKWTDSMVRLLIMIVYCVGDDLGNSTGTEAEHHPQPSLSASAGNNMKGRKAPATSPPSSAATSAGMQLLQKKGKWKSVSRAMMEKGFYVSPQQCEDKFNDLNKRYKRVNELLGKGTACRVVENQALLDSMDHLPPKAKEEARKLLNSKHLFFREMCAYHNSGGVPCNTTAGAAAAAAAAGAPAPAASSTLLASQPHPSPPTDQPSHQHQQQQQCFHHTSADSSAISFPGGEALFVDKGLGRHGASNRRLGGVSEAAIEKENHDEDDDEELEEDYDDDDEDLDDDNENEGVNDNRSRHYREKKESSKVEARGNCMLLSSSPLSASPPLSLSLQSSSPVPMSASMEQMTYDLMGSLASKGGEQQRRQWLKRKAAELEEQRVRYQSRALELERQRFKWLRYSSNKEREMERMKLSNERLCLESDRMLLLLRQKEQELIVNATANADDLHHSSLR